MSRSIWKGPYINTNIVNTKKIYSRNSVVTSNFINKRIFIYNGKNLIPVLITREKVGFKFGELSFTRKTINKKIKKK